MRSAAVEIVARGGVVGDRWRGELVVPTPGGAVRIGAEVTDADVRSLVSLLRGAHRALHALDDATRAQLVARQELAHRAALAQGAEVGVWPLVAAIAIPLLTAAAGYGVQATTPGFGGRTPSGAAVTTFAGSPVDETPREGGPSVEETRALWAAWERAGLLPLVLSWAGSWNPRLVRGGSTLSRHAYAVSWDVNAAWNPMGKAPAPRGARGSVVELVPLAVEHGYTNGMNWSRPDSMHFEVCRLI